MNQDQKYEEEQKVTFFIFLQYLIIFKDFSGYPNYKQPGSYDPYYYGSYPGMPHGKMKKFTNEFPRAKNYNSMESIIEAFPHLGDVNKNTLDIQSIKNARCFVMRSNNDDDIHKVLFFVFMLLITKIYRQSNMKFG